MGNQYWADGATQNCVWLFQIRRKDYGDNGCTCGAFNQEEGESTGKECSCGFGYWETENVFLLREEAINYGMSRPYAWGEKNKGWRIFGVQCLGIMPDLIGRHNEEFKDKVEYITPYKIISHVQSCKSSDFHGIDCLESSEQFGFFKDNYDIRPSSCTWIKKEDAEKCYELFVKGKENEQ